MKNMDEVATRIFSLLDDMYRKSLERMTKEQLHYTFSERIGDECREFEWLFDRYGKECIIDRLVDTFASKRMDDCC